WTKENTEEFICKHYSVTPGEFKIKLDNADWLLYSISEFSKLFELKDVYKVVSRLRVQLKNGVSSELLKLVSVKGIGRVRARALYDKGFRSASDVRGGDLGALETIVGKKTAMKLKGLDVAGVGEDGSVSLSGVKSSKVAQKKLLEF
ncbi:MAG: hypothetical protein KAI18_02470, partial [Candidatus Aenigmarchaeota archaeon]|nr:hypothetical protein [Candidatus Aenigmarchaeota archaeon]